MIRIKYNAPVILSFSLISLVVLVVGNLTDGYTTSLLFCVYRGSSDRSAFLCPAVYPCIGSCKLVPLFFKYHVYPVAGPHSGGKVWRSFAAVCMVLTAFVTGIAHLFLNGSAALLVQAGIVFMLILLASFASFRQGTIPLTFLLIAGIYIGNEIITGIATTDHISQMSHIIGGACGAFLGCFLNRKGFRGR